MRFVVKEKTKGEIVEIKVEIKDKKKSEIKGEIEENKPPNENEEIQEDKSQTKQRCCFIF